jgi:hypothetical protein
MENVREGAQRAVARPKRTFRAGLLVAGDHFKVASSSSADFSSAVSNPSLNS